MTSERECFVYIVPPGATGFVTAGRFRVTARPTGDPVGAFVYGRRYRERADAVEFDPVELRLSARIYETARMEGFFGAVRDAMPDAWGRPVIERHAGLTHLEEFDYPCWDRTTGPAPSASVPVPPHPRPRPRSTAHWISTDCRAQPMP